MLKVFHWLRLGGIPLLAALLAGCGNVGAPLPPSLELPRRVQDLEAVRKGKRVILRWTVPADTTDDTPLRRLGTTRICRSESVLPANCREVGAVAAAGAEMGKPASFTYELPEPSAGQAYFAVEVFNDRGRSAGFSNVVSVPLAPTLPAPTNLSAAVTPAGVVLRWEAEAAPAASGASFNYRIRRQAEGAKAAVPIREVDTSAREFTDAGVEWEKTYTYIITPITLVAAENGDQPVAIEGDDSQPVQVAVRDTFAPAAPTGVQAVYTPGEPGFVDLTWSPNNEDDMAGYFVFRQEGGAAPVQLNAQPVAAPAFRDNDVARGRQYAYTVVAVDLRGNRSAASAAATERLPPQ